MEAVKRAFLPIVTSLILFNTPLTLGGCNPQTRNLIETNPILDGWPTMVSAESMVD